MLIFQTIGVNQNISCITIPSNCEKSGTKVDTADVNLVKAITKQYNLKTYHMVFAIDDTKDFIQNEERRNGHEVFQELNY